MFRVNPNRCAECFGLRHPTPEPTMTIHYFLDHQTLALAMLAAVAILALFRS